MRALTKDIYFQLLFRWSKILGIQIILNRLKAHIRRAVGPEKESVSFKCRPSGQPPLQNSHRQIFLDKELACPNVSNERQPYKPKQHRSDQAQGQVHEVTQEVNGLWGVFVHDSVQQRDAPESPAEGTNVTRREDGTLTYPRERWAVKEAGGVSGTERLLAAEMTLSSNLPTPQPHTSPQLTASPRSCTWNDFSLS